MTAEEAQRAALELRNAGQNDGAILMSLAGRGLSPEDAEAAIRSLGGRSFALEKGEKVRAEWPKLSIDANEPASSHDGWMIARGIFGVIVLLLVIGGVGVSGVLTGKAVIFAGFGLLAVIRLFSRARS